MTLLADSLCVGVEASADYWTTLEENHETACKTLYAEELHRNGTN